ncbi:MAG: ATP-binding protein [Candidatus Obscuribacterales bacterium]
MKEIEARKLSNTVNGILASSIRAGAYGALAFLEQDKLLAKETRLQLKVVLDNQSRLQELPGISDRDRESLKAMIGAVRSLHETFNEDTAGSIGKDRSTLLALHMNFEDLVGQSDDLLRSFGIMQEAQRATQDDLREQIAKLVLGGVFISMLMSAFLAYRLNRDLVRRIKLLLENYRRLAKGEELLRPVPCDDEIGDLDSSFHELAGSLQGALRREQAILDNTAEVILSIDLLLEIQFVNPACSEVLGFQPEELIGKEIDFLLARNDVERVRTALLESQKADGKLQLELGLVNKSQAVKQFTLRSSFSQEEGLIFCVLHDVTARRELERKKSELIAMVSHDMRSPLTALKITLGSLEDGTLKQNDDVGKQVISECREELDRLVRLVGDLLEGERVELGRLNLKIERTATEGLIGASIQSVAPLAREKAVVVDLDMDREVAWIDCDRDRTVQVLTNLLTNAIKFSPPDSRVKVKTARNGEWYEISVEDQGPGIEPEERELIFEQFHQSGSGDQGGSGLGLFIARQIVEAEGGTIGVDCDGQSGSRFWFRLPL